MSTSTFQEGSKTEFTSDYDSSLTTRQHVRAAIRWWLPQDPMTKQQLGFTAVLLAGFCLFASLVTWSIDPLQALVGLVGFVLKLILLWRGAVTAIILFFCLTQRARRLVILAEFWQEYSNEMGKERLLPGARKDIQRSRRRRDSRRYLLEHGFSRKEARRCARM